MTATAMITEKTAFESFLETRDDESWSAAITSLLRHVHQVDKAAVPIWFSFYPLTLFRALQEATNPEELERRLLLQGKFYLRDQIGSSHTFLYGHRYWPAVARAVTEFAESFPADAPVSLEDQILMVARTVAEGAKTDESLVVGITAVAFMTVTQAGLRAFKAAPVEVLIDARHIRKSADQILREREKDDSQGLLGFLKTVNKRWTVTFDENDDAARYKLNKLQDLAWGAADDHSRNWREIDPRRVEGPIPVECRSASCGTCWIGVLGGAQKLSNVAAREGKKIKEFGYIDTPEQQPVIRLACQAQAYGAVSIVIPPWNGVFGKYLKAQKEKNPKKSPE